VVIVIVRRSSVVIEVVTEGSKVVVTDMREML